MTLPNAIIVLAISLSIALVTSAVVITSDKSDYELCLEWRLKSNKLNDYFNESNAIKNAVYECSKSLLPPED